MWRFIEARRAHGLRHARDLIVNDILHGLWRDISGAQSRTAGCHVWVDSDDVVIGNGRFMAIQASEAGKKVIYLPGKRKVTDAVSNRVITDSVSQFALDLQEGETRMFFVDQTGK